MRTVVLGNGFLGNVLKKDHQWDLISSSQLKDSVGFGCLRDYDAVVNTIALTDTRKCQSRHLHDMTHAIELNVVLPMQLSEYCEQHGKKLAHISTACLYAESDSPVIENGCKDPITHYAMQKFMGEKYLNPSDLILRSRLFFGSVPHRSNLLSKIIDYKTFGKSYNSFTSVDMLSKAIEFLLQNNHGGIFNVVNDGCASISELAGLMGLVGDDYVSVDGYRAPNVLINNSKLHSVGFHPNYVFNDFATAWGNYPEGHHIGMDALNEAIRKHVAEISEPTYQG